MFSGTGIRVPGYKKSAGEPEEVEEEAEKAIDLWYEYDGALAYGKVLTIQSKITGYKGELTYHWKYSTDGVNWMDIEGAPNEPTYSFILDKVNCWYYYDLVITEG